MSVLFAASTRIRSPANVHAAIERLARGGLRFARFAPIASLAVAALALLAGCASPEEPSAPDAPRSNATTPAPTLRGAPNGTIDPGLRVATNVTYTGCLLLPANVPLPEEDARALLPEGFAPQPFQGAPGTATGVLFALSCASADTGLVLESDILEFGAYLGVEPPESLRNESVDGYRLMLTHVVPSEILASSYAAMGHAVAPGEVAFTFQQTGGATTGEATVRSESLAVTVRSSVADFSRSGEAVLRFFEMRDGVVVGGVDFAIRDAAFGAGEASYTVEGGAVPFGTDAGGPAAGFQYTWPADAVSLVVTPFTLGNATLAR